MHLTYITPVFIPGGNNPTYLGVTTPFIISLGGNHGIIFDSFKGFKWKDDSMFEKNSR